MKKSYFERAIIGAPQKEDFSHAMLPSTRRGQLWTMVKTKFPQMYWTHLLTVLWFLPLLLWNYFSIAYTNKAFGGTPEQSLLELPNYALTVFGTAVPLWMIAFVGLSGGVYVFRRMAWSEPVRVWRDFFHGVKSSGWQTALVGLVFAIFVAIFQFAYYWLGFYMQIAGANFGYAIGQMSCIVALALLGAVTVFVVNVVNLYNISFLQSWWAGLKLLFSKFFANCAVLLLTFIPIILPFLLGTLLTNIIGYFIIIVGGLGFAMLLWTQLGIARCDEQINKKDYPQNYLRGLSGGAKEKRPTVAQNPQPIIREQPLESDFEVIE